MIKSVVYVVLLSGIFCLNSCYQIHSDDDLRTIPVTNNPNIVPSQGQHLPSPKI